MRALCVSVFGLACVIGVFACCNAQSSRLTSQPIDLLPASSLLQNGQDPRHISGYFKVQLSYVLTYHCLRVFVGKHINRMCSCAAQSDV